MALILLLGLVARTVVVALFELLLFLLGLPKMVVSVDINELATKSGYVIREHVVVTKDDYLLVLHKIERENAPGEPFLPPKPVYFHHGLLTDSELFLLGSSPNKILPFILVDLGYDVWLGNNRGNKYSRKHLKVPVCDPLFWDFSLDEFALYDIPQSVDYVWRYYGGQHKLAYVGFSQGCSQLFASISLRPDLNEKLNLFVALLPAVVPRNLNHPIFRFLVKHTAQDAAWLHRIFGNRALLPLVAFWCHIMGPQLYERVVDVSLRYLFGWTCQNIGSSQKAACYPYMFSNTSVKALVHWFQIIHAGRFQMYDETDIYSCTGLSVSSSHLKKRSHKVTPFPVSHHLKVPTMMVYGDKDILVDIESTKKLVFGLAVTKSLVREVKCPGYEHMDTLWGDNVYEDVFCRVVAALEDIHRDDTVTLSGTPPQKSTSMEALAA